MKTSLLASMLVIGLAAAAIGGGTIAFFSDTETSTGNTLAAGTLDLKVNGFDDPVPAVVTLSDLKPSIPQYAAFNLTISDNPGKLWKHIKLGIPANRSTGVMTEPECKEEGGTWIQANKTCVGFKDPHNDNLFPFTDFDLSVNGTPIINASSHISLDNATSCWIPLGTFGAKGQTTTVTVNQSFHLQNRTTNWAQGDINVFTEEFMVTQVNAPDPSPPNPDYPRVWNPIHKMCVPQGGVATQNEGTQDEGENHS